LSAVFTTEELAGLKLGPIGPVLANTVASTYPVASASSSVTYVYNPAAETFERRTGVLGPIFGERTETVGAHQFDVGLSYSYVSLDTINGDGLGHLVNKPQINGRVVSFPVPGGVTLADGRFSNFLPIKVMADIGVEAQLATPSITYGITPDLDINASLPLIRTYLRVQTLSDVPDPRLPQFALSPGDPNARQGSELTESDDAVGIGDLLFRSKYAVHRGQPFDVAVGLGLSLPTGKRNDFQGTGTTRVQPELVLSRVIADRFQPLLNLGVDINADNVDRSVFRWAVGATAQIFGPLTGAVVFLGRNEFNAQTDPIDAPFFLQINRNDFYDASIGLRYLIGESGVISANVIVPLNRDGFRSDAIPTVGGEYAFSAPW
jgi:outer membrane putative beta-barrel porin/alpha-amylase